MILVDARRFSKIFVAFRIGGIGVRLEEDWRRTGGGLEEDWRRIGGGSKEYWRSTGGGLEGIEGELEQDCRRIGEVFS